MAGQGDRFRTPEEGHAALSDFPGIEKPLPTGMLDLMTGAHIARQMRKIERAAVYPDGRHQTNAEHSHDLAYMCAHFAGSQRDDLNIDTVMSMCRAHDLKEVYSGDTPIMDTELLETKDVREEAGLAILLLRDFVQNAYMTKIIREYEACESPEAKFVTAMDKLEPVIFALETEGATHRIGGDDFPTLVFTQLPKTFIDPSVFHLMVTGLKQVGLKWDEWGCKPFKGNPIELVDKAVAEIRSGVIAIEQR